MLCENVFCIYESCGKCLLDEISLNSQGQCNECIRVEIPKKHLTQLKHELLSDIETRYDK